MSGDGTFSLPLSPTKGIIHDDVEGEEQEEQLLDWIDEADDEELRQVLNYLVLLNGKAVRKAIHYVQRRGRRQRIAGAASVVTGSGVSLGMPGSVNASSTSGGANTQANHLLTPSSNRPPLPSASRKSTSSHDSGDLTVDSSFIVPATATPADMATTPTRNSNILKGTPSQPWSPPLTSSPSRQAYEQQQEYPRTSFLLILCTSQPANSQQAEYQDKAIQLCKKVGILPFIVLKETKSLDAEDLMQVSKISTVFPQFFVRKNTNSPPLHSTSAVASTTTTTTTTEFLGDYETIQRMYDQGAFTSESIFTTQSIQSTLISDESAAQSLPNQTTPSIEISPSDEAAVSMPTKNSPPKEPTRSLASIFGGNKDTVDNYEEGDQSSSSNDYLSEDGDNHDEYTNPFNDNSHDSAYKHLNGMNQPKAYPSSFQTSGIGNNDGDDARSIDADDLFDPPKEPLPDKPLLAAAQRAAETRKKQEDINNGVPNHLAGLAQPTSNNGGPHRKSTNSRIDSFQPTTIEEEQSLGDDPMLLFDSPKEPLPDKPLLVAAQRAAENRQKQQDIKNGVPSHLAGLAQPSSKNNNHTDGRLSQSNSIDEEQSLGTDPTTLFDAPKTSPPSQKPLLDAAKKAAAEREQQRQSQRQQTTSIDTSSASATLRNSSPTPSSTSLVSSHPPLEPNDSTVQRQAGFSNETITLRPVGTRRPPPPSTRMGETNGDAGAMQPPPSPALAQQSRTSGTSPALASPPPVRRQVLLKANTSSVETKETTTAISRQDIAVDPPVSLNSEKAFESPMKSPRKTTTQSQTTHATTTGNRTVVIEQDSDFPVDIKGGACYLVLNESASNLDIFYSESPIHGAVGVWTTPHIKAFKEAQGLGSEELIGNCANGVLEDHQAYFNGWIQFVKAAKSMEATITILDMRFGVPMDVYVYINGTTKLYQVGSFETEGIDAVACLPRDANFPMGVKGKKWTRNAKKLGAVVAFRTLSSRDGFHPPTKLDSPAGVDNIPEPLETPSSVASIERNQQHHQQQPSLATGGASPRHEVSPSPQASEGPSNPGSSPVPVAIGDGHTVGYASAMEAPNPPNGACYLIYEPDSSGRLVEHYSKHPLEEAIGRWVPEGSKKIAGFKFKQNLGRTVLIGSCSAGVQGRKNYASGWCQFVRSARVMESQVMLWNPTSKGLMVDVYLYMDKQQASTSTSSSSSGSQQTIKLQPGVTQSLQNTLAVACVPKNTPFYEGMSVDILKWLADGSNYGASSRF